MKNHNPKNYFADPNKSITFSHTKSTQASWTRGLEIFTSQILI
jgi:hypothetical protein